MEFSFDRFSNFVTRKANDALVRGTGIDALGGYYDVRNAGFDINTDRIMQGRQSGQEAPEQSGPAPKETPKEKLCTKVDDLIKMREKIAKIPLGGAVVLIHALLNYADPKTRAVGEQMLVLSVTEDNVTQGNTYKGYSLNEELSQALTTAAADPNFKDTIASLIAGTSAQKMYKYNPKKISFMEDVASELGDEVDDGDFGIFIWSSGDKQSPRRIQMNINAKGIWKAKDFSSLLVSVSAAPVASAAVDDL